MLRSRLVAWRSVAGEALDQPDGDREERDQRDHDHLRQQPEPEPDDQQGGDGDDRQRLGRRRAAGSVPAAATATKSTATAIAQPDGERHGEPDRRHLQRRHGVGPQLRPGTPTPAPPPAAARAAPADAPPTRRRATCHTDEPGRAPAPARARPAPPRSARCGIRDDAGCRRSSSRAAHASAGVVGEPGREVRPRGERLPVRPREHARVVQEAGEPGPLSRRLGADLARGSSFR